MLSRNVDALILKSINFKDSDKIFTLLTKENGRISAKAKGIRKFNSKRMSFLDTLNYVKIGIVGESDIKTITEARLIYSFSNIKKDLDRLNTAYYFIEILNKLIQESDDNSLIFDLVIKCLKRLDEVKYPDTRVENYFEIYLLQYLGYTLELDQCLYCSERLNTSRLFAFNYEGGGLVCINCQEAKSYINAQNINSILYLKGELKTGEFDFSELDTFLKFYINDLIGGIPKSKKYLDFRFS